MAQSISSLLFYPFEKNILEYAEYTKALIWGAEHCPELSNLSSFDSVQSFKPSAMTWGEHSQPVLDRVQRYQAAFCVMPQQKEAALYRIAKSLNQLDENGLLLGVAANDAGGKRLEKWFQEFGLETLSASKNKCRIVWAYNNKVRADIIEKYATAGAQQEIILENKKFTTQPGIFGWHKIDNGSRLLIEKIEDRLSGIGADFGCGYGFLSDTLFNKPHDIKKLYALDADYNALECAKKNLKQYESDVEIKYDWIDLTQAVRLNDRLDWIVTNPPFHTGKTMATSIGVKFIETSAQSLRNQGVLYMVANAHLPYERALESNFSKVERCAEENGFKVFRAVK